MTEDVDDSDGVGSGDDEVPTALYDFVADVRLRHPSLPMSYTLRTATQTTVHLHGWRFTKPVQFFSAMGGDFGTFERALLADPTVDDPVCIDTVAERRIYRVSLSDVKRPLDHLVESGALVHDVRSRNDGWLVRFQARDRNALADTTRHWRRDGINVSVLKLATRDTVAESSQFGLSKSQYDLLLSAFDAGYFDVPRRVSQTDIAERLDISPSAASTQLRRAVSRLIETTVTSESPAAYWASRNDGPASRRWRG